MKIRRVYAKKETTPLQPNSTGPNRLIWILTGSLRQRERASERAGARAYWGKGVGL